MENKDFIKNAKSLKCLPECWIKRNGKFNYYTSDLGNKLPVIPVKYKYVLDKFGISSYKEFEIEKNFQIKNYLLYWDGYHSKEKTVELPVYEFSDGTFIYQGMHTGKILTDDSVKAAKKLSEKVDYEIGRIRKDEMLSLIKYLLNNKAAVYANRRSFRGSLEEGKIDHYHVFFIHRLDGSTTDHIIIFDLDKICEDRIVLELPEKDVKYICGRKNCNANKWVNTLGIKEIEIDVF